MSKFIYPVGCNPDGMSYQKRNIMTRYWKQYLSVNEFMVLDTIFDRTIGWKKKKERIPMRHFLKGYSKKNGEVVSLGMPISESSVLRALAALKERGIIKVTYGKHCRQANTYEIDFGCLLGEVETQEPNIEVLNPVQNLEGDEEFVAPQTPKEPVFTNRQAPPKREKYKTHKCKEVNRSTFHKIPLEEYIKTPREKAQEAIGKTRARSRRIRRVEEDLEPLVIVDLPDWEDLPDSGKVSQA